MKEYIKLFQRPTDADGYNIIHIPFTTTIKSTKQNIVFDASYGRLINENGHVIAAIFVDVYIDNDPYTLRGDLTFRVQELGTLYSKRHYDHTIEDLPLVNPDSCPQQGAQYYTECTETVSVTVDIEPYTYDLSDAVDLYDSGNRHYTIARDLEDDGHYYRHPYYLYYIFDDTAHNPIDIDDFVVTFGFSEIIDEMEQKGIDHHDVTLEHLNEYYSTSGIGIQFGGKGYLCITFSNGDSNIMYQLKDIDGEHINMHEEADLSNFYFDELLELIGGFGSRCIMHYSYD